MCKKKRTSNRNKAMCHATKQRLIEEYGTTCMLCLRDFGKNITHHHVIPRYAGGSDNFSNGSLLCSKCQQTIHYYDYGTEMYSYYTEKIVNYKKDNKLSN